MNTDSTTGIRGFAPKADRVREYLAAHPGATTSALAYGAKLNMPGPMGHDGRSDAMAVCAILEGLGEVVRKTDGSNYSYYLAGGECIFPLNPEHDREASGAVRFAVRRRRLVAAKAAGQKAAVSERPTVMGASATLAEKAEVHERLAALAALDALIDQQQQSDARLRML